MSEIFAKKSRPQIKQPSVCTILFYVLSFWGWSHDYYVPKFFSNSKPRISDFISRICKIFESIQGFVVKRQKGALQVEFEHVGLDFLENPIEIWQSLIFGSSKIKVSVNSATNFKRFLVSRFWNNDRN